MHPHVSSHLDPSIHMDYMTECVPLLSFKLAVDAIIEYLVVLIEYILMCVNTKFKPGDNIRVIPGEINKENGVTSWILIKFGMFIIHIKVTMHTKFYLHVLYNFQLTAKNMIFLKKMVCS